MTHICVSKSTIIGSDNGLSPGRHQAIIWTNDGILMIGPLGTNFSEIRIRYSSFHSLKLHLNPSSVKWWPFCPGGDNLMLVFSGNYKQHDNDYDDDDDGDDSNDNNDMMIITMIITKMIITIILIAAITTITTTIRPPHGWLVTVYRLLKLAAWRLCHSTPLCKSNGTFFSGMDINELTSILHKYKTPLTKRCMLTCCWVNLVCIRHLIVEIMPEKPVWGPDFLMSDLPYIVKLFEN